LENEDHSTARGGTSSNALQYNKGMIDHRNLLHVV
jgi:hypothetical protein